MIKQSPQCQRVAPSVEVGEPLRDLVIEAQLACVAELQECGGGELFGDGSDLEDRVNRQRDVPFDVRLAVSLEQQGVVALDDRGGDADRAVLEDAGASQGVELPDEGSTIRLRSSGRDTGPEEDERRQGLLEVDQLGHELPGETVVGEEAAPTLRSWARFHPETLV